MRRLKSRTHITKLVYSPDPRYLFSIGGTSTAASVWDLQAGKVVQKIYVPKLEDDSKQVVKDIAFCVPNKLVLSSFHSGIGPADGTEIRAFEWPVKEGVTPSSFTVRGYRAQFYPVPNEQYVLIAESHHRINFWNPSTGDSFQPSYTDWRYPYPIGLSADTTTIAWSSFNDIRVYRTANTTTFEIENQPSHVIPTSKGPCNFLRFHPFEKQIAVPYRQQVLIDDTITGEPVCPNLAYTGTSTGLAFTPDGTKLLLLTDEGILHIWNANTYEEIATYDFGVKSAKCLAVSPDSLTCAIGGGFLEIVLVDLE